ncbi:MAG: sulfatase-like hydrolase/transferase [Rhodospirillaceae bacterium]|jgi:arylsulfatase A-like enzyme|nr:sulfatase-like hydrolase/transferase [Rhodospirillaceae bacterium]MBT5940858.1 sulfatase-like hydrolase/transferase [Rhodospirillaceae bacterium]MBT7265991.1 sulfatase-like hydrolase/transferase [Rhodospirillaceae bacterium]
MSKQPNFLFIITDQHKFDHLGCYGNAIVKTPNIDSLSDQGLTYDKFYAASPICMPNRATLMTGRMPAQHRVWLNGLPLAKQNVTFVELLRLAGYKTGLVGKCHLQPMMDIELPESRFWPTEGNAESATKTAVTDDLDSPEYDQERAGVWRDNPTHEATTPYYGFEHLRFANFHADMVHGHYRRWLAERHPNAEDLQGPQNALKNHSYSVKKGWRTQMPEELYPTTYITEETISFLKNHAGEENDEPFFLECSFPDPHAPLTPPGRYWDLYDPTEVELPNSFEHVDPVEPAFVQKLRESHGTPKKVPAPITPDEKEAREMIALTYGSISMIDDAIGKILAALDELSLTKDTIVIFTADHGDMMGDHGMFGKFGIHYEAVLKVPFIWKDPINKPMGRVDQLGGTIDIGSSILARAGVENVYGTQGFDIISSGQNNEDSNRLGMFVEEDQLSEQVNGMGSQRIWTFIYENWRLSIWLGDEVGHLFDRDNDPDEMNNLWHNPAFSIKKAELTELMLRERMRLADTLPLTNRFA